MQTKDEFLKEVKTFSANNYHPLPIVLSKGEGVWVWDSDGKKYLDCLAAYSAVNQGHRHPKIIQALKDQADQITLTSRAFHNDQMGPFLNKLCRLAQFDMVLPMNSGAEAVETAVKLARRWGYEKKGVAQDQAEIIVCTNNFHGRTTTLISFSSEKQYREGFGPFTPGFKIIPYGDERALSEAITDRTVGFLVEPIQGEAGVIVPPKGYLSSVRKICSEKNVLLLFDEIQTGLGRTGRLFCYEHEKDSKPDILILGKALGGGVLPVSAVLAPRTVMEVLRPGDHGSTFGGNPLAAAVGMAALAVIQNEKLVDRSNRLGAYLFEKLQSLRSRKIKEIRGKGLMLGLEIKSECGKVRPFCEELARRGILAKDTHDQVIRLTPPLVIEEKEIDWLVETLQDILKD